MLNQWRLGTLIFSILIYRPNKACSCIKWQYAKLSTILFASYTIFRIMNTYCTYCKTETYARIHPQTQVKIKALYLYPIHAGLHLQLLHSFPGLGDAGRAVVGDTVLHGAPVTPNAGTKGGHIESMNITLNPQSSAPTPGDVTTPPLEQPFSTTTFLFKGPILSGESVLQQPSSILSEERGLKGSSWTAVCHFTVSAHAWLCFLFLVR